MAQREVALLRGGTAMATVDKPKSEGPWISGIEWLVCSVLAFVSGLKYYPEAGLAGLLGGFVGSLMVIILFWVIVRGIYRWIKRIA